MNEIAQKIDTLNNSIQELISVLKSNSEDKPIVFGAEGDAGGTAAAVFDGKISGWPNDSLKVNAAIGYSKNSLILDIAKTIFTNTNFAQNSNAPNIASRAIANAELFYSRLSPEIKKELNK